ncbi:MAG: OsmC family protein [Verrucomicrobiales bacterium]
MVEINIDYEGGLHCAATHGPSGSKIATDAPVDNNGRGEAFSPTDLAATALGSCMLTVMGIVAERKGLEMSGAKVSVRKHMSAESPRRIAKLELDFHMPLSADHPERELLEATGKGCPVHHSLHPDIDVVMNWSWEG